MTSGTEALEAVAPEAADALNQIAGAVWLTAGTHGLGEVVELAGQVCAQPFGLEPLPRLDPPPTRRWPDWSDSDWRSIGDLSAAERAFLAFAEQFSIDVSGLTDQLRRPLFEHFGAAAGDLGAVVFALDFLPRTSAALVALFGADPAAAPIRAERLPADVGIWQAFDSLIRTVPRLSALDPVTGELVRLRGARQHNCRLCQSLRSRPALVGGADDAMFAAVDDYRHSELPPLATSALAFTDAMVWTPGRIPAGTVADLQATATPDQQVEVVLDVTRNALNKVAVALGADAPHVEDGIEIYDIDPDGELVYGLSLD